MKAALSRISFALLYKRCTRVLRAPAVVLACVPLCLQSRSLELVDNLRLACWHVLDGPLFCVSEPGSHPRSSQEMGGGRLKGTYNTQGERERAPAADAMSH
eukprot:4936728-Pyramimonas_sp.AAC.1